MPGEVRRARRIAAIGMLGVALCACSGGDADAPAAAPTPRVFSDERTGLSFELPADWEHTRLGSSHVFSGPSRRDTYYTTVTVQIVEGRTALDAGRDGALDAALEAAYHDVAALESFRWELREPVSVAGRPGLRYSAHFDLHETPRRKSGLLLDTGGRLVDISYASTPELFPLGLPAFEALLGSLSVY
jgi:hypothetical protein